MKKVVKSCCGECVSFDDECVDGFGYCRKDKMICFCDDEACNKFAGREG